MYTPGQEITVAGITATVQWHIGNQLGVIMNDTKLDAVITVDQIDEEQSS
jgi:tryptophanyl-tRNA synthetase